MIQIIPSKFQWRILSINPRIITKTSGAVVSMYNDLRYFSASNYEFFVHR